MESAVPSKFTIKSVAKDLQPTVKKLEGEDEILARLANYPEWETLKGKIQSKIDSLERLTDNVEAVDDLTLYGFKCMTKNILIDELQSIISLVDDTAEYLKKHGKK